ncbi:beta-1,3-galactosyltransferase 5-like [Argopecten irradians]|uniref:beta-1,3-galactosyltransferase 5-like n=1 Tax=Argopecten irradians TaxID=31199 RepID=UPI0037198D5B
MGKTLRNVFISLCVLTGLIILQNNFQIDISWNRMKVIECIDCNKFEDKPIIEPPEVCSRIGGNTSSGLAELLILIMSSANDRNSREAIRETWGGETDQKSGNFRIVFVIGKMKSTDIVREASDQRDILQVNVPDTRKAITEKVVHSLRWFVRRCPGVKYVMKTNVDVFISVPYIVRILRKYDIENTLAGHCNYQSEISDRSKRYSDLKSSQYPPYCTGSGYVISRRTAVKFVDVFGDTPYIPLDDVYIGFCAYKTNVDILDIPRAHVEYDGYDAFQYCQCVGTVRNIDAGRQREIYVKQLIDCRQRWSRGVEDLHACFVDYKDVLIPVTIMVLSTFLIFLFLILRRRINVQT